MKPTLAASLVLVSLLGSGLAYAAAPDAAAPAVTPPASAPPAGPPAAPPAAAPSTAASEASNARNMALDRAAFFEARLAALHAGLTLTPAQEALWPPLEKAVRDIATFRRAEFQALMMQRRADAEPNANVEDQHTSQAAPGSAPFDMLKETGARLEQHGKALQALADAAQPMFASLSPDQTRRLPMLLRGLVPQQGPIARLMTSLGVESPDEAQGRGDRMGRMFQDDNQRGADGRDGAGGSQRDGGMGGRHHGPMAGDGQDGGRGYADRGRNDEEGGSEQYGDMRGPKHHPMDRGDGDRGYGGYQRGMDGWDHGRSEDQDRGGERQGRWNGMTDRNPDRGDNGDRADGSY